MKTRVPHKRNWMVVATIRLDRRTKSCLKALARAQGLTFSSFAYQHLKVLAERTEPTPPTEGVAGQ